MSKREKQTVTKEEAGVGALAVQDSNLQKYDFNQDADRYVDQFDRTSLQIPFLRIIQSNSPEIDEENPKFIADAKMGEFVNTVTQGTSKNLTVIPVYHYATFIEWVPRTEGGGFVKDHGFDGGNALLPTCHKNEKKRDVLPNGNELVQTEIYFVMVQAEDGSWQQAMATFTSTALKKARQWNSKIRIMKTLMPDGSVRLSAPMFWNSWKWTTVRETNKDGSWYNFDISEPTPILGKIDVYQAAKEYREVVEGGLRSGTINVADKAEETKEENPF